MTLVDGGIYLLCKEENWVDVIRGYINTRQEERTDDLSSIRRRWMYPMRFAFAFW